MNFLVKIAKGIMCNLIPASILATTVWMMIWIVEVALPLPLAILYVIANPTF